MIVELEPTTKKENHIVKLSTQRFALVLTISANAKCSALSAQCNNAVTSIVEVLPRSECADNVFLGDLALLPDVGALLWPRLAGAYIQQCLAPLLPSGNSDMAAFDQVSCLIVTYSTVGVT